MAAGTTLDFAFHADAAADLSLLLHTFDAMGDMVGTLRIPIRVQAR